MKLAQRYAAIWLLCFVSGCAGGLTAPDTFNKKLAVGYATVTEIRADASTLLVAKKITADDAQHVQDGANNARTGLDIAKKLSATDITSATGKLTAVSTALQALKSYLATKGN